MTNNIISLAISLLFLVVIVTNVVMPALKGANTTSWTTAEIAIWSLGGLAAVGGTVYSIANMLMG
jgi:hypothetical protein